MPHGHDDVGALLAAPNAAAPNASSRSRDEGAASSAPTILQESSRSIHRQQASDQAVARTVAAARPPRWRIWLQAIRVPSFTASVVPILIGSSLALVDGSFHLMLLVAMLIASVACHAGANLANDYYDHLKGVDAADAPGPGRVIQQGLLTPGAVRTGMLLAFVVATAFGLVVVVSVGWPILLLALVSLAAAWGYTGGPRPLGYLALGELTVLLFMGPVMVDGAYYVLINRLTLAAVVASLPIGLLAAAILHANNIRDMSRDAVAGKLTLAIRFGRPAANAEFLALIAATYLSVFALVLIDHRLWPVLIVLTTLAPARRLSRRVVGATETDNLNDVLRRTAGLHLRFGVLFAIGLLVAAMLINGG